MARSTFSEDWFSDVAAEAARVSGLDSQKAGDLVKMLVVCVLEGHRDGLVELV